MPQARRTRFQRSSNGSDGIFIDSLVPNVGNSLRTAVIQGNVISGNRANGIDLLNSGAVSISGNTIGTDPSGTIPGLGNSSNGIFLNGSGGVSIQNTIHASLITAGDVISGNLVSGNLDNGIFLANQSENNVISGNEIGTDATGTLALPNSADGIFLLGGRATIGGSVLGGTITGNVISGNTVSGNNEYGLEIFGPGATRNSVSGNTIGGATAIGGTASPPGNGADGIYLNDDAGSNTIGPANVISGNAQSGILIFGTNGQGGGDLVEGNRIGTNGSGTGAIPPNGGNGVFIYGTQKNTVSGNTISGNAQAGVSIFSPAPSAPAQFNSISGNLIGVGSSGTDVLGNQSDGVDIFSGNNNLIGPGNVIAGNVGNGVLIAQVSDVFANDNTVSGNDIGVGSDGSTKIANGLNGVFVENGTGNVIGAAMGGQVSGTNVPSMPSNVISGNGGAGVEFSGAAPGNFVLGNYIGVDSSGSYYDSSGNPLGLGNGLAGVFVDDLGNVGSDETIGNSAPGAGNIIAGSSSGYGVDILGPAVPDTAAGNVVQGNLVGVDRNSAPAGNISGIYVQNSARNTIGGPGNAMNVISANSQAGVELTGLYSTQNEIQGNEIGTDITGSQRPGGVAALSSVFPIQTYGVFISAPSPSLAAGAANNVIQQNVISGNLIGINITGVGSGTGTGQGVPFGRDVISGNLIGTDRSGSAPNPNFEYGISIDNSAANTVGGTASGSGNVLSANGVNGVEIFGGTSQTSPSSGKSGAAAARNVIEGNLIGVDASGVVAFTNGSGASVTVPDGPTVTLGEQLYGVVVIGSSSNIIGAKRVGNTIGGNVQAGVYVSRQDFHHNIYAVPTNNTVNSNIIMNNGVYGVYRYEAPQNSVAMGRQRFHNTFRGNYIDLADYIKTLNTNTQLPRIRSKFSHAQHLKTGKVAHPQRSPKHARTGKVAHAAPHAVHAIDRPHARVETVTRPRIPALFLAGVETRLIEHAPSRRHR